MISSFAIFLVKFRSIFISREVALIAPFNFPQVSVSKKTKECIEKNGEIQNHPEWLWALSAINHLMLLFNSSVNFLIYCAVGSRFRNALTCRFRNSQSSSRNIHYQRNHPMVRTSSHFTYHSICSHLSITDWAVFEYLDM